MSNLRNLCAAAVLLIALAGQEPAWAAINCDTPNSTAPVAVDDRIDWPAGQVLIPVLQNDYDPNGHALTITAVSSPGPGGQVQIVDGTSIRFTPAAGHTTAQFSYSVTDSSGQTCARPAWVYVREPAPSTDFTWVCTGTDCNFRAVPSTLEHWRDYTWRFTCPEKTSNPCSNIVKTSWKAHGVIAHFWVPGTWKAELEVNYLTGKVAYVAKNVEVPEVTPYMKFKRLEEDLDKGLCVRIVVTESNAHDAITSEYKMFWGDGTTSSFTHLNGAIVNQTLDHCYADPGLYQVTSQVTLWNKL